MLGRQHGDAPEPTSSEVVPEGADALDETLWWAIAEAETPGKVVLEHLMNGFALRRSVGPLPSWPLADGSDALAYQCAQIDTALSELQHVGTADGVLALPGAISALLESRLEESSPGIPRLELATLAVQAGGDDSWIDRALDAAAGIRDDETRFARVLIGCVRLGLRQYDAGLAALEHAGVSGPLTSKELGAVGLVLAHLPLRIALRLLRWCAERTRPINLLDLIEQIGAMGPLMLMAQDRHARYRDWASPDAWQLYPSFPEPTKDTVYQPPDQSALALMAEDVVWAARTAGAAEDLALSIRLWLGLCLVSATHDEDGVILLETNVAACEGTKWAGSNLHISSRGAFSLALARAGRSIEARAQVKALEAAERERNPSGPNPAWLRRWAEAVENAAAAESQPATRLDPSDS
jgi:hypothetical protein